MAEEAKKQEFPGVSPWDLLIWKLDSLEKYVQREIGDLRRELGDLRHEVADLRREVRETRRSFTVLELTTIIGFLAVLASILAVRFL
ncbi:MAG: hypothetical protein H5T97_10550 [Firmicutes bacterium]|nr:hypothetical protein [Bacillota bacterium]